MTPPNLFVDFTDNHFAPVAVGALAVVQDYSFMDIGGPNKATINLYGSETDLWKAIEMLGYGVNVRDKNTDSRWWGYVYEATVTVGGVTYGVSLESMANRVQVTYTSHEIDASGQDVQTQAFTDWASDAESILEYGTRESRASLSDGTDASASAYRDTLLGISRWPSPAWSSASRSQSSATLHCKGWWYTLDNRYYANAASVLSSLDMVRPYSISIGPNGGSYKRAGFHLPNLYGLGLVSVTMLIQKMGQPYGMELGLPTGNLRCEVWTKAPVSAQPGSLVGYAEVPMGSIPNPKVVTPAVAAVVDPPTPAAVAVLEAVEAVPITWYFTDINFTVNTDYYFIVSMDGGDYTHGYVNIICTNSNVEYAGVHQLISNSSWAISTNTVDGGYMVPNARLETSTDTTVLISQRISSHAQFITGVRTDSLSGVYQSSLEDGSSTLRSTIENLLALGSSTSARLLATVTPERVLYIYPEPLRDSYPYLIDSDGAVSDPTNRPIPNCHCPVGIWVKLKGVIPASVNTYRLADASIAFVEEADYNVSEDTLSLKTRGQVNIWNIGDL